MGDEITWREMTGKGPLPTTLDELTPPPEPTAFDDILDDAAEYWSNAEIDAAVKEHDAEVLRKAADEIRNDGNQQYDPAPPWIFRRLGLIP